VRVTDNVITALAVLGVVGQVLLGALVLLVILDLVGQPGPLAAVRSAIWGYELWLAVLVTGTATAGSLFLSEVADFIPCELCWFQRYAMYPLAGLTLLAALFNAHWAARWLLPVPVVGAAISVYHLLVENRVVEQTEACLVSAPGGCATKWIDEFGYMTIPTLALTAFALAFSCLLFAALDWRGEAEPVATVPSDG
jgi:disulfide bond formation protein DsbB